MFHSQDSQDRYLETHVFKGFKNGVFMDIGAYDGVHINNTLFFENQHNWSGVNIEPNKMLYDRLLVNRPKCINLNCAVANNDGYGEFIINSGCTDLISGLKDHYDPRHFQRLRNENEMTNSVSEIISVHIQKIETICDKYNINHIHYLSIDVEGAEFDAIKSINFDKVFIDIIDFESNYGDVSEPIVKYLQDKGYHVIHHSLDIIMIHHDSIFAKNVLTET